MNDMVELPVSRLRWMCRRGMKELDVLMTRYLDESYAAAPAAQRASFVSLLAEVEDPDIWAWVMGHQAVPEPYADIIRCLIGSR